MNILRLFIYILCLAPNLVYAYPQRIVSTIIASDEILLKLLEDGDDNKRIIAAVSKFALSREYSHIKKLPAHIKHQITSNVEFLVKLKPDLVVITSFSNPNKKEMLKRFSIPFYEMRSFDNITGIEEEILKLGKLIGKNEKATEIVSRMKKTVRYTRTPDKTESP